MRRALKVLSIFRPKTFLEWAFIALFGGFSVYAYWAIYLDQVTGVVHSSEVITPEVRPGENFQIRYDVTWDRRCTVTGYRFIVDGAGFRHDRVIDTRDIVAGPDNFFISISVPAGASPGQASYQGQVRYACNWLQGRNDQGWGFPFTRNLTPREFTILPPMSSMQIEMPLSVAQCPMERPVFVKSHCRSMPNSSTIANNQVSLGNGIDIIWSN